MVDRAKGEEFDTDGQRHMAKAAWRALAALQKEIEEEARSNDVLAKLADELWEKEIENSKSQKNAERDEKGRRARAAKYAQSLSENST